MSTEELGVEVCDHRPPHWCAACRPPRDDDEGPVWGEPSRFSTDLGRRRPVVTAVEESRAV